jgi:hypothetical protein
MKNGMFVLSLLFVFFFSMFGMKQEKVFKQKNNEIGGKSAKTPADVKEIEKKAERVLGGRI